MLVAERCEFFLGERMEEVKGFKYLGTVLSKHGEMEGKVKDICILLPTLTYGTEMWIWHGAQQSKMHAMEVSYLRGAYGVTR